MSKRGFSEELVLPGADDDWGQTASPPPSPSSLTSPQLRMPGAWLEDEPNTPASGTLFETLSDLCATVTLANLISLPLNLARRYFRPQRILAVPVDSSNGSRKKRLIDLGPADRSPAKPRAGQNKSRPAFVRKYLLTSELEPRLAPTHIFPGQWREDADLDQAAAEEPWMISAMGRTARKPTERIPARPVAIATPVPLAVRHQVNDFDSPQSASTSYGSITPSIIVHSPTDNSPVAAENTSTNNPPPPHKILSPVNRKVDFAPIFNRRLAVQTSPRAGRHTNIDRARVQKKVSPTSHAFSPLQQNFKKTAAYKLAVAKVAEDAREASELYLATHKARTNKDAELRPNEESDDSDSFVYQNDQSFLSDAPALPPKKSVSFLETVRAKPFYYEDPADQMLDSVLEDIKTCEDPLGAIEVIRKRDVTRLQNASSSRASSKSQSSNEDGGDDASPQQCSPQSDAPKQTGPFRGVPPETFDDDDLDESLMSNELMTELLNDVAKKLLVTPPQPPPPVAPTKPLVAELTTSESDTLEEVAKKTGYGMQADYKLGNILTAHDFGTLLPKMFKGDKKAWLNDEIINEYLTILTSHQKKAEGWEKKPNGPAPPSHNFASQWYQTVKKDLKKVEKWASRQRLGGKNFLDAKVLLYPVCEDSHWRLLAFKPQERLIVYLDSLGGTGREYTETARKYLAMELGPLYESGEWRVATEVESQIQENARDCGVFTLLNALVLLRGEEHSRVVVSDGMDCARRRIAATLLAGQATGEME